MYVYIYVCMYVLCMYTYIHAIILNFKKEAINLKKSEKKYMAGLGEWGGDGEI